MPGIVKVRILEARDLPVMDRASELTDAYVDVKFHERNIFRTQVCSKTLCPKWNSDWFTFEVDDEQIQEDLLQIKVFDKDTVTANDPIGKVHVSLVPLTSPGNPSVLSGWFPIFDTIHGIRGEIKIIVKVKYISETNQSSCGVKFFYSKTVPSTYTLIEVKSFVEELVIEDDPEYKWIDKIRTTRASNEARTLLFLRLAASLQRKIGSKVLDLGGNAVVGYRQCFDLEGSFGVVVRAIGTCVTIKEAHPACSPSTLGPDQRVIIKEHPIAPESEFPHKVLLKQASISKKHSCNSDSQSLSETASFFPDATSPVQLTFPIIPSKVSSNYADFPFYTMGSFPPGFVSNIGGLVSSRSVRLLDKLESMPEESDTRDKLWLELRKEVRTHMKTLGCSAVIGYSEQSTICDKLCVLSAIGTAVILNLSPSLADEFTPCQPCHIPYNLHSSPFNITPHLCAVCGTGKVPDILLTTIDTLPNMPVNGNGCFIQVQAFRTKKKQTGENSARVARDIGQQLPFLEYEIHQQLTHKLKIKGMNAVVGIRYELCVGHTAILYIASGTAVCLSPLPPASPLRVRCDTAESTQVDKLQEAIQAAYEKNVTCYNITRTDSISAAPGVPAPDLNLSLTNKDVIIVDIEDPKDEKKIESSLRSPFPDHMYTSSSSTVPGINGDIVPCEGAHILTQICRIDTPGLETVDLDKIMNRNMQLLCFKLRKYKSCFLSNIRFNVHMPDEDELVILISAIGTISLPVSPIFRAVDTKRRFHRFLSSNSNEIRFCEDELSNCTESAGGLTNTAVQLTPADHIPGTTLRHCYGHINIFLIRESSDVRDLSSFTKNFIMESQAIMRAHVASLGGNVLFEYRVSELVLIDGPQKFQAQILLNISGDAANLSYDITSQTRSSG